MGRSSINIKLPDQLVKMLGFYQFKLLCTKDEIWIAELSPCREYDHLLDEHHIGTWSNPETAIKNVLEEYNKFEDKAYEIK